MKEYRIMKIMFIVIIIIIIPDHHPWKHSTSSFHDY